MLTSITPLGERGRSQRYAVTMTAYALGCALGGALTGGLLGLVGSGLPPLPVLVLGGAACLLAATADLRGWLPLGRRQVDQAWLGTYRGWVYGAGFGVQLGLGVVTIVSSAATLALLALALLTQSVAGGDCCSAPSSADPGAAPRCSRGRVHTHADLRRVAAGLQRRAPLAARATVAGLAAAGHRALLAGAHEPGARRGGRDAARRLGGPGPAAAARSPSRSGNLLLHAATVPLPAERGDFGSGVVETLGPTTSSWPCSSTTPRTQVSRCSRRRACRRSARPTSRPASCSGPGGARPARSGSSAAPAGPSACTSCSAATAAGRPVPPGWRPCCPARPSPGTA
jgi:hypothetical protein